MAEHFITNEEARDDLLSCAVFLAEEIKSADGHAEAMKAIVPLYLDKNDVDLAAELSDTVDDPYTRDRLLVQVAEKCAAIDDDEYAFQLVEAIEDYGMQSQGRERIALQKSAKGEYEEALKIAETLLHPDDALAVIAVNQAVSGNTGNAERTLEMIEFPNAKVYALRSIAIHNLKNNNKVKALDLLEKAVLTAGETEHTEEKIRAILDIGHHYIEAKRNDKAIETFDRAKHISEGLDNVHRDSFLAATSLGFLHAGSLELADRTLDLVTDKTQISSCLVGFAGYFGDKGEKDEALETIEEAYAILKSQHEKETRDSRAKYGLFSTIAVQFASFEKGERALEIAQNIEDENVQMSALAQIAQVFTLQGKDELARQAIQAIFEDSNRMFALIGLSDTKNRLEKKEEAVEILNEAAALAETVQQHSSRSGAFNELAKRFLDYDKPEKAREISQENLEIISEIRNESSCVVALANLSEVYKQAKFELNEDEKTILEKMIRKAEL